MRHFDSIGRSVGRFDRFSFVCFFFVRVCLCGSQSNGNREGENPLGFTASQVVFLSFFLSFFFAGPHHSISFFIGTRPFRRSSVTRRRLATETATVFDWISRLIYPRRPRRGRKRPGGSTTNNPLRPL